MRVVDTIISAVGVFVVTYGVWVAIDTLKSIEKSVTVAENQLNLSAEQFTASFNARWLDQRPWLPFSRAETVPTELEHGEDAIVRFHVLNSGRTPAFNVRLLQSEVGVYPNTYVFSEPSTWTLVSRVTTRSVHTDPDETTTVFPNSSVYYDVKIPFRDIGWRFEPYTKKHFYIGVTVVFGYRVEARKSVKCCAGWVRMSRYVEHGSRERRTRRFEGAPARAGFAGQGH